MKKNVLITSLLITGFICAKTGDPKNSEEKTLKNSNIENITTSKKVELNAKKLAPFYAYTSCGVAAVTYQNWTFEQGQIWSNMIEANYYGHGY